MTEKEVVFPWSSFIFTEPKVRDETSGAWSAKTVSDPRSAIAETATSRLDPSPPNALPVSSPARVWKNRGSAIR